MQVSDIPPTDRSCRSPLECYPVVSTTVTVKYAASIMEHDQVDDPVLLHMFLIPPLPPPCILSVEFLPPFRLTPEEGPHGVRIVVS